MNCDMIEALFILRFSHSITKLVYDVIVYFGQPANDTGDFFIKQLK